MDKGARHYLENYAEPEWRLSATPEFYNAEYEHVVIVPARNESAEFLRGFHAAASAAPGRVLIIVVVNASEDALESVASNEALLQQAPRRLGAADVYLVDRNSRPLPAKSGAGLARKIGNDVALALHERGIIRGRWLAQCDADATLPPEYFSRLQSDRESLAVTLPFRHVLPTGNATATAQERQVYHATLRYEVLLRYQLLGMRFAQARFAWHSLGSCMAVSTDGYVAVRGFPKRMAGEDFYMLNKLSKLRLSQPTVATLDMSPLRIQARLSARVPFGTGPSVQKLLRQPLLLRDPRCFEAILRLNHGLRRVVETRQPNQLLLDWLSPRPGIQSSQVDQDSARLLQEKLVAERTLQRLGAFDAIEMALARTRTADDLELALASWFDGLKLLRFIHALRDELYPDQPWVQALRSASFLPDAPDQDDDSAVAWETRREWLAQLEANSG